MMFVGFDPGTRHSGMAAVKDGQVICVASVNAAGEDQACERVAFELPKFIERVRHIDKHLFVIIESQEYRRERGEGSPGLLFPVAHVAGAAYGAAAAAGASAMFVAPMTWKGSVPKLQYHRRMMTRLGWLWQESETREPYCVPCSMPPSAPGGYDKISKTSWPDVLDAIGMALWLETQRSAS